MCSFHIYKLVHTHLVWCCLAGSASCQARCDVNEAAVWSLFEYALVSDLTKDILHEGHFCGLWL